MSEQRLARAIENSKRAESITGIRPISGGGWEKVGVLLIERIAELEAENARLRAALSAIASMEAGTGSPDEACDHPMCAQCEEMQSIALAAKEAGDGK